MRGIQVYMSECVRYK